MTITELRYIVALAKEQHFGRAAKRVFVSQPTLSIGIKKLEEELGIPIFERLSHKVIPTQAGQKIIGAAQNTLMSVETIRSIAEAAKGEPSGDVKLGAIYTVCPYLLPKIIPDLQKNSPNIRLYIEEGYTENLMQSLREGALDVALVSLPIEPSNLFEVKEIFTEPFYAMIPAQHALSQKDKLSTQDLAEERVFLLGSGNCLRDQVLEACPACKPAIDIQNTKIQGGSLETIRMMVAGGLGLSVFPKMAVGHNKQVAVRPFTQPTPKRQIALAWRKSFTHQGLIEAIEASILRCR